MHTVPNFASHGKLYTPRAGAPVRYATYTGFEGWLMLDSRVVALRML